MASDPKIQSGGNRNSPHPSNAWPMAKTEILERRILEVLDHKGPLGINELADEVWRHLQSPAASPPSVCSAVARLAQRRLVVREVDPRGAVIAHLTERGAELARQGVPV